MKEARDVLSLSGVQKSHCFLYTPPRRQSCLMVLMGHLGSVETHSDRSVRMNFATKLHLV